MKQIKKCVICKKQFNKTTKLSKKQWNNKQCCSTSCSKKLIGSKLKGRKQSDATLRKRSEAIKNSWKNKEVRESRINSLKKLYEETDLKKRISQALKKHLDQNPEYKKELIDRITKYNKTHKEEIGKRTKKLWGKGVFGQEHKDKLREGLVNSWKNNRGERLRKNKIVVEKLKQDGHYKKLKKLYSGKKAKWWKDEKARYSSKHRWIQKHWIKTEFCQICGDKPKPSGNRKFGTEWANISGEYKRNDKSDWIELCPPCHRRLDKGLISL